MQPQDRSGESHRRAPGSSTPSDRAHRPATSRGSCPRRPPGASLPAARGSARQPWRWPAGSTAHPSRLRPRRPRRLPAGSRALPSASPQLGGAEPRVQRPRGTRRATRRPLRTRPTPGRGSRRRPRGPADARDVGPTVGHPRDEERLTRPPPGRGFRADHPPARRPREGCGGGDQTRSQQGDRHPTSAVRTGTSIPASSNRSGRRCPRDLST